MVYFALIRSVAEYAAPAWFPWTAKTNVEQLETAQLAVARAITVAVGIDRWFLAIVPQQTKLKTRC